MKKQLFLIGFIIVFAVEIVALIVFAVYTPDFKQDVVAVNEIVQSVTKDFNNLDRHTNGTNLDYAVLDSESNVIFKTKNDISESVAAAIAHRDTVLDLVVNGAVSGKVIIYNDGIKTLQFQKQIAIVVLTSAMAIECVICLSYAVYLHKTVIKPFYDLKSFAKRVAGGNLDIPLKMDRLNVFGAFTESFDVMRSELKKARLAEARAQQSKKELVAKLSHDIKTPVASIKAVSEVGLAVAKSEKDKINYLQIIGKADQINTLISNLFSATLEELQQLTVSPESVESAQVKKLIENADYLHKAICLQMPECLIYADKLRLQQVFDNIFANSYKYADTEISVVFEKHSNSLRVIIEDFGGGVKSDELPVIKEKFKRGSNSANTEGAGLGLYISDYFMKEMSGALTVENGEHGLKVIVTLALSGKI